MQLNEVRILPSDPFAGKYDFKNIKPFKESDTLRVYHGFYSASDALNIAKFGVSGQELARRIYSYESGNNPYGLFVTLDFKKAKNFASGVDLRIVMEFQCRYSDLEAPVWVGGRNYFVQGEYTKSFKDMEEREAQRMANRQKYSKPEEAYDDPVVYQSDRPELAFTLRYVEASALFVGNLNPNMIRRFWVTESKSTLDAFKPYSRIEFLKKFVNPYVERVKKATRDDYYSYERFRQKESKAFRPNDDFNMDTFIAFLKKEGYSGNKFFKEEIRNYQQTGKLSYEMEYFFYPKQLQQIKQLPPEELAKLDAPVEKQQTEIDEEIERQQKLMGIQPFTVEYFQKRIPFLKSYEIGVAPGVRPHPNMPDRIEMMYDTEVKNVKQMGKDEIYTFPRVSLHSHFFYYSRDVNDYTFYVLGIENQQRYEMPANMDDLTKKVFGVAEQMNNQNLSATFEIPVRKGTPIDKAELDKAINEINGKLFKLEETIGRSQMEL